MPRKPKPFDDQVKEHAAAIAAIDTDGVRVAGLVIIMSVETETGTEMRWCPHGNDHAIDGAVNDYLKPEEVEDEAEGED